MAAALRGHATKLHIKYSKATHLCHSFFLLDVNRWSLKTYLKPQDILEANLCRPGLLKFNTRSPIVRCTIVWHVGLTVSTTICHPLPASITRCSSFIMLISRFQCPHKGDPNWSQSTAIKQSLSSSGKKPTFSPSYSPKVAIHAGLILHFRRRDRFGVSLKLEKNYEIKVK